MMYNVLVNFFRKKERGRLTMKRTGFAALLAAALMLTSCGVNSHLKKTAIEIGDVKVSAGDVAVMTDATMEYMGADFDTVKKEMVDQIEMSFKLGALGEALGIELTDEEKAQAVSIRAGYASSGGGLDTYKKFLKDNGSGIDFLDKLFLASSYQTKIYEKVNAEFEGKDATDEELKKYYDESYLCAKHILINKEAAEEGEKAGEKFAKELLDKAKSGEDFDAMMAEHSKDPGSESAPEGYVFTDGEMVPEFENTVKEIKPGEIGFCESDYGYHIIKRLDLPAFEDNKEAVSSTYSSKRVQNRIDALYEENGITSTVNQEVIDALKEDMLKKTETETAPAE